MILLITEQSVSVSLAHFAESLQVRPGLSKSLLKGIFGDCWNRVCYKPVALPVMSKNWKSNKQNKKW